MTYRINEIFYTLQGEGYWTGRAAAFIRFSQCNLWTGREEDRASAICRFCDTTFVDYQDYGLRELVRAINDYPTRFAVLTGGEPMLQVDNDLIDELHNHGWYVAIETNGSLPVPDTVDWVCVSPKTPKVRQMQGDELKLVYPQERVTPGLFVDHGFKNFWLSPMDGPNLAENTAAAIDYVKTHPQWRLNTQTHKQIGIR